MLGMQKHISKATNLEKAIKKDLECLNPDNYKMHLFNFGYECDEISDINAILPTKLQKNIKEMNEVTDKIKKCIPKDAAGVYVFEVKGGTYFADKWAAHRNFKKAANLIGKNRDSPILYIGKDNDLRKRLANHIYGLSKNKCDDGLHWQSTSGLKLSGFIDQNPGFKFKVNFFYKIKHGNTDKTYMLLNQMVESVLHSQLNPRLGSPRS